MDDASKARWEHEFIQGDVDVIRELLSEEPELVGVPVKVTLSKGSVRQWGPLFTASNHMKDLEVVKALVEAGADLNNSELGTHWPSDDFAINKYLIEQGMDVNQASYLGFHGLGVTGLDSFFLMLENGLNPNASWPYNGETLLHVQARDDCDRHLAQAYGLIQAGANVNAQALSGLDDEPIMNNEHFIKYGKETPLHFAARLGNIKQVYLLLSHGADLTLKTVSRMVEPKQCVGWEGDVADLTWPLRKFERILYEPYQGETPLDMAVREGHEQIARVLSA